MSTGKYSDKKYDDDEETEEEEERIFERAVSLHRTVCNGQSALNDLGLVNIDHHKKWKIGHYL